MSWIKRFAVCAAAIGALAVSGATAMADYARGYFNSWEADCPLTRPDGGNYYSGTLQAHVNTSKDPGLKFDLDGNWGPTQWGGTAAMAATVNQTTGYVNWAQSGNVPMDVVDGAYYTFHLAGDYSWGDRTYLVMKTQYPPSTILNVQDDSATAYEGEVTLLASCSAGTATQISSEETLYILYTTDGNWNTAKLVEMSGSGLQRRGKIPGQTVGTTVQYKVFSTTMPTNYLTMDTVYSTPSNLERIYFCMLSLKEGSYTTVSAERVPGNVWHNPGEYEPFDSATMRDPETVRDGDTPYIRLGSYPTVASGSTEAPDTVKLWYRVQASGSWGSWTSRGMHPGPNNTAHANNDYFTNSLPKNKMVEGNVVEYCFEAAYANSDRLATTFLGTTNQTGCVAYTNKATAQANPFRFTVAAAPALPLAEHVWHEPADEPEGKGGEKWTTPMRNPLDLTEGVANVAVFVGTYQADAQGENMTGGQIFYSIDGGAFVSTNLVWGDSEMRSKLDDGWLKFWKYDIDTSAIAEGGTLAYYFVANVDGCAPTYIISDGTGGCVLTNAVDPATDALFTATCGGHVYNLGNCWHIPANAEPAGTYMRNPTHPYATSDVWIYNGNQDSGEGNPGDQTGGVVYYRKAGTTAWSETNMWFDSAIENNKFWLSRIPANAFSATESVEYVIKVTYAEHDDTYLGLAAAGDTASSRFGTLEEAAAHPFDFTYAGEAGQEPAFVWHGGNAVKLSGTNVQIWVKTGYIQGTNAWADQAQIRYKVVVPDQQSTVARQGVRAIPRKKGARAVDPSLTETVEMRFDHTEEDPSGIGQAMWWVGSVTNTDLAAAGAVLRYQIAVRRVNGGNGTWRLAEYQAGGANDTVFEYTMASSGANTLTVNGLNADYTTSKFFIDESKGESAHLHVVYSPANGATDVQVFSNVGRRDFWDADIDGDHVYDSIKPPSGDRYTAATTNGYYRAWPMTWDADAGVWTWDADIGKTGAYRLTARYKVSGDAGWHYYSTNGIRDHAIVISPKKVLEQNVYEVNGMTAKASAPTLEGHSTFEDLIEGADGYAEFGIPYLNNIGANCLWFQPIHTSSGYGLKEGYLPGSPYAAKDYFSVSKWYGKSQTTAGALEEFQHFVAACDAGRSGGMVSNDVPGKVGTINIMLDGVFNHTSWDAVFGVMGEQMGLIPEGTGASTAIASVKPGWYANCSDYGAPATWYRGPEGGNHDIASGPDRGDFGKWLDTAELFYGNYSALVRHNHENDGDYLNEGDWYDFEHMSDDTVLLWKYMGSYVPYWLDQTGHDFGNERTGAVDENGTAYDDYGIDGLRCDFGQGLPPQFWEYCINRARAKKWNFMFMAESLDGGKVSYRSNRHFDILNESFVFAARNAGSPSDLLAVTDDKKAAYNGGAVLLNLTSHDEVMPYSDPWKTASRYAMVATVKGLPMTMYGQEQGIVPLENVQGEHGEGDIVMPEAPWTGFAKFELNFGKWVADFKTWNKLTVWENPPMGDASREMAKLYGRINRARQGSPALQSDVQWMLDRAEGYRSTDVWAMAKAEEYGALANGKDAVLAFVLFVNDTHYATSQTFSIPAGAAAMLGLEAGESYTARNLVSGNAEQILWTNTTEQLTSEGVWVNFPADQNGSSFYDDGAMVQFLKLEKYVPPTTHDITVTVGANGSVSPSGTVSVVEGEDQEFVITAASGYRIESVLADGVAVATFGDSDTTYTYTWENVTADGTLSATFVEQSVAPVAPVVDGVTIPIKWIAEYYPSADPSTYQSLVESDGANGRPVWESYVAGLDPTDADSDMVVGKDIVLGTTSVEFDVSVPGGRIATVTSMDNISSEYDWGKDAVVRGAYTNSASATTNWVFTDTDWNGKDIRFYRLQMQMNP